MIENIQKAVDILHQSKHTTVFTGAGISVESGIPTFRGQNGLWDRYNPIMLEINNFYQFPKESWQDIKTIFYDEIGNAQSNPAHYAVAKLEEMDIVKAVITQNIDNLHQEAGSQTVYEFHGTVKGMICTGCNSHYDSDTVDLSDLPPRCEKCNFVLKPDFVFFGEPIPEAAREKSFAEAELADVFLIIGTTGEVMPACMIPVDAKRNGAKLIEINIAPSKFTSSVDLFIQGKAGEVLPQIVEGIAQLLF